jgi:hypothetical protein
MFNNVSHHELTDIITNHFPELSPITNLIYSEPGAVKYKWNTDSWNIIDMKEGVTQGCPLSATFAALVLTRALIPLYKKLQLRAKQQLDEGDPGETKAIQVMTDSVASHKYSHTLKTSLQ